ncbi:D-alanyl-D-alanine carboxypeptidase family protein [Labrys neptuniae]
MTGALAALVLASPAAATPVLVVDAKSQQVLLAEDAGKAWYPASTTKLMTTLLVFESIRAGKIALNSTVVMSPEAAGQKFPNSGLAAGQAMTVEDALYATIVGSSNEVAFALAETVAGSAAKFTQSMNKTAARLGMTASHFSNPNGLYDPHQRVSARDLAILALVIRRDFPEYQRFFSTSRVVINGKDLDSHNELLARFPGVMGMKTGFLCYSGNNMVALAEREGRQVLVVLLGATTERERSERTAQLLTQSFDAQLQPIGQTLTALKNDPAGKPPDMRRKLCGDETPAYERSRDAMYPMGLPGQQSYLGPVAQVETHQIRTWQETATKRAPKPSPRPAN